VTLAEAVERSSVELGYKEILKFDESCISNPKSEILNWTVNCEVQFEISKFRI
jgi:hypothetical protein